MTGASLFGQDFIATYVTSTTQNDWPFYKLPDTGQTGDYTNVFGEDSDYSKNPPSYTDNGNDTVTDNVTCLVWQKQDLLVTRTLDEANVYCSTLNLSGMGWRLPSKLEIFSLVDCGKYSPAINQTYFPSAISSYYWSSTTYAADTSYAHSVSFAGGYTSLDTKSTSRYVRCVRGGQ